MFISLFILEMAASLARKPR